MNEHWTVPLSILYREVGQNMRFKKCTNERHLSSVSIKLLWVSLSPRISCAWWTPLISPSLLLLHKKNYIFCAPAVLITESRFIFLPFALQIMKIVSIPFKMKIDKILVKEVHLKVLQMSWLDSFCGLT